MILNKSVIRDHYWVFATLIWWSLREHETLEIDDNRGQPGGQSSLFSRLKLNW